MSFVAEDALCGAEQEGVFGIAPLMCVEGRGAVPPIKQAAQAKGPAPAASRPAQQVQPQFSEDRVVLVNLNLESYDSNPLANEAVARSMALFTERLRGMFSLWLSRSNIYLPIMTEILREEGIPVEMAYLPLIESGFNPKAYSRMKAAGPWQFIAPTAKRYGLKITPWVDERRDPVKSTRAAARYLKDLHQMFGSWSLAMAAYNAGEGKIKRALDKISEWDYWGLQETNHIKPETKNYVPNFIAASLIATNPEGYGFSDLKDLEGFDYDEVAVKGSMSLEAIARYSGSTTARIKELNPELRKGSTPPGLAYSLRIPKGSKDAFMAKAFKGAAASKSSASKSAAAGAYVVRKGDSLHKISKKTGVSLNALLAANSLSSGSVIRPGQRLSLP